MAKPKLKAVLSTALSLGKGVISVVNPAAGAVIGVVQGTVNGVKKEVAKNLDSEVGGKGKTDWAHVTGAAITLLGMVGAGVAVAMGWLTMDEIKALFGLAAEAK